MNPFFVHKCPNWLYSGLFWIYLYITHWASIDGYVVLPYSFIYTSTHAHTHTHGIHTYLCDNNKMSYIVYHTNQPNSTITIVQYYNVHIYTNKKLYIYYVDFHIHIHIFVCLFLYLFWMFICFIISNIVIYGYMLCI